MKGECLASCPCSVRPTYKGGREAVQLRQKKVWSPIGQVPVRAGFPTLGQYSSASSTLAAEPPQRRL